MSDLVNLQLNDVTKFRLDETNKVKDYFNNEIRERKQVVKKKKQVRKCFRLRR